MAITKKQQLDILISAWEDQAAKGDVLTEKGKEYLAGLKQARKIVFGDPKDKKNGKGKITKKR